MDCRSNPTVPAHHGFWHSLAAGAGCLAVVLLAACEGDRGASGRDGKDFTDGLGRGDDLPGVNVQILSLSGGGSSFQPGNTITVKFTVKNDAGENLELSEMDRGAILVSGPSFNYQRVIDSQSDLLARSTKNPDGSYSYRFAAPIPTSYLAPLNDTGAFTDNELTGQPLLAGTYTVGIELRKDYTIEEETFRDPGNATFDFLLGSATTLQPRELVTIENCNQCHGELRAHGSNRTRIQNCLLCHTTGAEDRNESTVEGGTPGVSIDFKVMIHKIHTGKHLASVLGVTTNPDGTRKYDAAKKPYKIIGFNNSVHDYSHVALPIWPSLIAPMPRDAGYSGLTATQQGLEDELRSGVVDCDACHGDPDGAGPLPAPAQGNLIYTQPTRLACGSCHEDWVPTSPYRQNTNGMPAQSSDATCTQCHKTSGTALDIMDAHRHPLRNAALAAGINFSLTSVAEAGTNDGDGTIDVGEKIAVTFTIKNDAGADIMPSALTGWAAVVKGPTSAPNLLHFNPVASAAVTGGPTYTINLPEAVALERVGVSTGGALETFPATSLIPHWNVSGAATTVHLRTVSGFTGALAAAAVPPQNYLDVQSGQGASFAQNDYIVLEDGVAGKEEYLQIKWIEGDRLWFSSAREPTDARGPRVTHPAGAGVRVVTVATVNAANYSLNAATGVIAETTEFGAGTVLVSYTSDFVVPATYNGAINDSPDLGLFNAGDWGGLPLVDGTYTVGMYASRNFTVTGNGQTTTYREATPPSTRDFLLGAATTIVPDLRIDSAQSCYSCHVDIQFHGGGRRGFATCTLCHSTAGAEDRPRYLSPNGAPTPGVTIDFRTMLHKIHHGKELAKASEYAVVGFGGTSFQYDEVGFPAMPGGTMNCASCHGKDNTAWKAPASRKHPALPVGSQTWRAACASCHDSDAAVAHVDANTAPNGAESCSICHGSGERERVEIVHKVR
jgi:hypothetical protein